MTTGDDLPKGTGEVEELLAIEENLELFATTNRDVALYRLLNGTDLDSQLVAISDVLRRQREEEAEQQRHIERADADASQSSGWRGMQAQNDYTDLCNASVYQDAAHSMVAVGMIAPLIEGVLSMAFNSIRDIFDEREIPCPLHPRFDPFHVESWDCRKIRDAKGEWKPNLIVGIRQLSEATGVQAYLPADLENTLEPLFAYRNKMFHLGVEWPEDERAKFILRIQAWPGCFRCSTTDGHPWVFYMEETFIQRCLDTFEGVLDGFGAFVASLD